MATTTTTTAQLAEERTRCLNNLTRDWGDTARDAVAPPEEDPVTHRALATVAPLTTILVSRAVEVGMDLAGVLNLLGITWDTVREQAIRAQVEAQLKTGGEK